jgi:hypothetical protein
MKNNNFYFLNILLALLVSGCASVVKVSEKESEQINFSYRLGNVSGALVGLENAYNKNNNKNDKASTLDTNYYLEKGLYLSHLGKNKLNESTQNLLVVRNTITDWENQSKLSLKMSLNEAKNSISDSIKVSQVYIPRDYEKSLVGFQIMANHGLAKRFDLAYNEAKNTTELDDALSAIRKKELDVANAKAKEKMAQSNVSGGVSRLEEIPGYPIDTFNTKDVLELKNSYFNAGTSYLAGFIREARGTVVAGEAVSDYQKAININPLPFYKDALSNASKKIVPNEKQADTLIIVESGFLSDIYSFKAVIPFITKTGPKAVTWVVPAVKNNAVIFNPQKVDVNGKSFPLNLVSNIEAMSRRELKDQMPNYIARAVVSSVVQIVAQEVAANAIDRNSKDQTTNTLLKLVSSVAVNAVAAGDVDTRMWKSLPSNIYMTRSMFSKGENNITIPTPSGPRTVKLELNSPYEIIKIRVFDNNLVVANYPNPFNPSEYGVFTNFSTIKN